MTTYRTGTHGVEIIREGIVFDGSDEPAPDAELAAVVANGDVVLAELICQLLNHGCTRVGLHNCRGEWRNHDHEQAAASGTLGLTDHTPDVSYARGAREALAAVLGALEGWIEGAKENHEGMGHRGEWVGEECWTRFHPNDIRRMVADAAREMGVDETARVSASPQRPAPDPGLSAPPVTPNTQAAPEGECTCDHPQCTGEHDGMFHAHDCPVRLAWNAVRKTWTDEADLIPREVVHQVHPHSAVTACCGTPFHRLTAGHWTTESPAEVTCPGEPERKADQP